MAVWQRQQPHTLHPSTASWARTVVLLGWSLPTCVTCCFAGLGFGLCYRNEGLRGVQLCEAALVCAGEGKQANRQCFSHLPLQGREEWPTSAMATCRLSTWWSSWGRGLCCLFLLDPPSARAVLFEAPGGHRPAVPLEGQGPVPKKVQE